MAYCAKCGTMVAENVAYCPSCGTPRGTAAPGAGGATGQTGLAENVAGPLSYVFGWITGLIFFLIDKRPFVRFHAAQSMVVFGALHIVSLVCGWIFGVGFLLGGFGGFGIGVMLAMLVNLLALVLWVLCMVKAYQGERFKIPLAGDIAEGFAGK